MPAGDTYKLSSVQILYGVARTNTFYYIQKSDDEGGPRPMASVLIDSFEASAAYTTWKNNVSQDLSFICFTAVRVLPTEDVEQTQFGNVPGLDTADCYPPKTNVVIARSAPDVAGNITRKTRTRNWFMGIPKAHAILGQLVQSEFEQWELFEQQMRTIEYDTDPTSSFAIANITSRSAVPPIGAPLTSAESFAGEVRPRTYNLRGSTIRLCGTG